MRSGRDGTDRPRGWIQRSGRGSPGRGGRDRVRARPGNPPGRPRRPGLDHDRPHFLLDRHDRRRPISLPRPADLSDELPDYPKIGDRLWALLGLPWLGAALLQSATPGTEPRHNPLFSATLIVGLGVVCLIALIVVWSTWVLVSPEQAAKVEAAPWTNRLGLILSIAWPIQCGLGMVVLS